ncbi:hypothetical protein WJX72_006545 [[Myrmecia] bisecta]|uniref:Uncharacterized protein n=1 Tax=[Myrmecia] bisecta TaxID=41462 RepID=A0AAW1R7P7_9CHLO
MLHALGKGAGFVATQHSSKTCKLIFAGLFAGVNKSLTGRTALVSVHHNLSSDASVSRAFSTASYVPDVDEDIVVVDGDIESTALLYYYKKWDHARTLRPLFLQREDKERNGCNNRQLKAARKICANLGLPAPSMMEAPSAFPGLGWGTHACDGLKVLESLQQRPRAVIFPIARDSNNIRTHPLAFGAPTAQETPSKPSVDDETGMRQLHVVLRRVGSIPLVWPWSQKTRAELADKPVPVEIVLQPANINAPQDLILSSNAAFSKLARILVYLCNELALLKAKAEEVYPVLLMFGEGRASGDASHEGDLQAAFAQLLAPLRQLSQLLYHLQACCANLLCQLGALCAEQTRKSTILQGSHAVTAFSRLAQGLGVLLRLEYIIHRNPVIAAGFAAYHSMLEAVVSDAEGLYGEAEIATARQLQEQLQHLQHQLLGKGVFQRFLDTHVRSGGEVLAACGTESFCAVAASHLRSLLGGILERLSSAAERLGDRDSLAGLLCLAVVYCRVCGDEYAVDKKLLRLLLHLHEQVPLVAICSAVSLPPANFLSQALPSSLDTAVPANYIRQATALRAQQLERAVETAPRQLHQLALVTAAWLAHIDATLAPQRWTEKLLTSTAGALVRGLALAGTLQACLQGLVQLHTIVGVPVSMKTVRTMGHCACLLKGVEGAYVRHHIAIVDVLPTLISHVASGVQGLLAAMAASVRAKMRHQQAHQPRMQSRARRKQTEQALQDAGVAVQAAIQVMQGPVTPQHLLVLATCIDAITATGQVSEADLQRLASSVDTLRSVASLQPLLKQVASCGFLYFNQELLPAVLADVWAGPEEAHKLPYLLAAFSDAHQLLRYADGQPGELSQAYDRELTSALKSAILDPLLQAIETDLRVHCHAIQQAQQGQQAQQEAGSTMPDPTDDSTRDVTPLLQLPVLRLPSGTIDVRRYMERSLALAFHKYTALAWHDWRTYGEMAGLAEDKYGLAVGPVQLPSQELDQGMDLVAIGRSVPAFAAAFAYDLAGQVFIERPAAASQAKHLRTLSIAQMAQSIATHGLGICGPAFDAAYQFLALKFGVLQQLLHEEAVKARLSQEVRQQEGLPPHAAERYPLARAEQLAADLHRLGTTQAGLAYLNHLRRLVTEMGNALGLVRLLRQGSMRFAGSAASHLPNLAGLPGFASGANKRGLSPASLTAAQDLDAVVTTVRSQISSGPHHFADLVASFSSPDAHGDPALQAFHTIIPALSLNAVEAVLLAKEQLARRRRGMSEAGFTDDGFALGLAFVLSVLQQRSQFEGLQWFQMLHRHFQREQEQLRGAAADPASGGGWLSWLSAGSSQNAEPLSDVDAQNRQLALARLDSYAQEFERLSHTMTTACALFDKPCH